VGARRLLARLRGRRDAQVQRGIIFKRAKGTAASRRSWASRPGSSAGATGSWLDELLRPGTPRRDWKQTLLSDGHLMCRHPDWDTAKEMCFEAARNITLYAE
jgi:hypothetical protein